MTSSYTIERRIFTPTDNRLGRHVNHDSRSKDFAFGAAPDPTKLASVTHQRYIPILNQGDLGSCTGNAGTGNLGSGAFWSEQAVLALLQNLDADALEKFAIAVYSAATKLDSAPGTYPPTDTGSDGLSVAKTLLAQKLISGYQHAFSLEAVLTALAQQPVIVGTTWLQEMFTPDADGRLRITGSVAGGHEYVLRQLDVENRRIWMDNSWDTTWGIQGRAYFTWDDFGTLLDDQGDCTIFTPVSQPAPTPTPTPTPSPTPVPDSDLVASARALRKSLYKFITASTS